MTRQRGLQKGAVRCRWLFDDRVVAQVGDIATDETDALVHGIAEGRARNATDNQRPLLRHKPGHVAAVAGDEHHAALHGDAGARRCVTVDDHRAAAHRGGRAVAGTAADSHGAGQHRLGQSPAGATVDPDGGAVNHAGAVVADATVERDVYRVQERHTEIVPGVGVPHVHVRGSLSNEPLDFRVDLPHCFASAGYRCHTRTSSAWASRTSDSPRKALCSANSSVATATKRSVSVKSSGLKA